MNALTRVPLAWRNVTSNPKKFALSVIGVTFAVVLMFAELGFLTGVINAQVRLLDKLNGDLVLVSRSKANMFVVEPFPRARLTQTAGHPAVATTVPVYVAAAQSFRDVSTKEVRFLRVIAFDPDQQAFRDPEIDGRREELKQPDTVLVDRKMASYFGPRQSGLVTEVAGRTVRVVGTFDLGVDLPARGTAITSERTLLRLLPGGPEREVRKVEIGLVHLRQGADADRTLAELRAFLPPDVDLMTRDDFVQRERLYFLTKTPIGVMFALGLVMGAVVAGFICYQILYADVLSKLSQYATLKAMGYATPFIGAVVMKQAIYLGLMGFVAGIGLASILYGYLADRTGFPMEITPLRGAAVLGLTLVACAVAALLAAKRPLAADPAEAF